MVYKCTREPSEETERDGKVRGTIKISCLVLFLFLFLIRVFIDSVFFMFSLLHLCFIVRYISLFFCQCVCVIVRE